MDLRRPLAMGRISYPLPLRLILRGMANGLRPLPLEAFVPSQRRPCQRTIQKRVTMQGTGLHTGRVVSVTMAPAPPSTGVTFIREDRPGPPRVSFALSNVIDTYCRMVLGFGDGKGTLVSTTEHVTAAIHGLGIDNVELHVQGRELPAADGSARPWVELVQRAGIEEQSQPVRLVRVRRRIEVNVEGRDEFVVFEPFNGLIIHASMSLAEGGWSTTSFHHHDCTLFAHEVAPARTFTSTEFARTHFRNRTLMRGANRWNGLLVDPQLGLLEQYTMRFPNEFIRHKILDFMGDVLLAGPLLARVTMHNPSHTLSYRALTKLLSSEENYDVGAAPSG